MITLPTSGSDRMNENEGRDAYDEMQESYRRHLPGLYGSARRMTNDDVSHTLQRFTATFQPERTDDLRKPEMVGVTCEWETLWICEPDEKYPGVWAVKPYQWGVSIGGWCPIADLVRDGPA